MIEINMDITTVPANSFVAHGVNCKKVMGSGVALAISNKWPKVKEEYLNINHPYLGLVQAVNTTDNGITVFNCFTQIGFGKSGIHASAAAIRRCLTQIGDRINNTPLYIPRIGAGLGGLSWDFDVVPEIIFAENLTSMNVIVCNWR